MNTATLRTLARDAAHANDYAAAAVLYAQAADAYPSSGSLADHDISILRENARIYAAAAAERAA